MKINHVSYYLVAAILTLAILPFLTSYILIDEIVENASSLVVKPKTEQILLDYQQDLKALRRLQPENEQTYRARFKDITNELVIYQQPQLVQKVLRDTYLTYYLILFIIVLIFSLMAAIFLSRKVTKSYRYLMVSDIAKAKKIHELSYFDEWQIVAGKLAHEINNPLTPIEMMVSNLSRIYLKSDKKTFEENLHDTEAVVSEEITKLKVMVSHFNKFAKLPEPILSDCCALQYLSTFIQQYKPAWKNAELSLQQGKSIQADTQVIVSIDNILFNQCLMNLINNAVQANPSENKLKVVINLAIKTKSGLGAKVHITVSNEGKAINELERESIFKMHYSGSIQSGNRKENMGLGLTIVRKIILDHNGEIKCNPLKSGAAFNITLPLMALKSH